MELGLLDQELDKVLLRNFQSAELSKSVKSGLELGGRCARLARQTRLL